MAERLVSLGELLVLDVDAGDMDFGEVAEQDLRLRVRALQPDVVVLYPTPVQYLNEERPLPAAPDSAAPLPRSARKANAARSARLNGCWTCN